MNAIQNIISDLWGTCWFKVSIGLVAFGSAPIFAMSLLMQSLHATVGS